MTRSLLHTPEGVRDIYNQECAEKMVLQEKLQQVLKQYGYAAIQTPMFEFFDIFGSEIGTTPSKDLYKFFDKEGNTLALRPDITPSVARSVTKYFAEEEMPVRLWYRGNTFINNSSYQGRMKETTQLGAEFIGEDAIDADAEVIALVVELLKAAGLKDFQITVGHVDFLKGLMEEAGFDSQTMEELEHLISNKNFFGVEELVAELSVSKELKELFSKMGNLYNSPKELLEIKEMSKTYPKILRALDRMIHLYEILTSYGVQGHISIELGMITDYRYYTGIIFAGYTFGTGEAIVKGGRYDDLLPYFGKNAPSVGFAVVIDQLMAALSRQKIQIPVQNKCKLLVYAPEKQKEAIEKAQDMRKAGEEVMLCKKKSQSSQEMYLSYAKRFRCTETIFFD